MNWHMFGIFGYLSVALAAVTVVLWLVHWRMPARFVARAAMALAVLAYAGAKLNSLHHVNRIQIDPAEYRALANAREAQRRQAALASRGGEVADIRFAEDAEGEYYDRAGMDDADLKYLDGGPRDPEWKQQPRQRGDAARDDDSLENQIGAVDAAAGVADAALPRGERQPAALMSSGDLATANRLDRWNLNTTLALMCVGWVVLAHDYLRRANIYRQATLPLPLPGGLRNAVTPMPAVVTRPPRPRRSVPAELAWLVRRGETFVYFAPDHAAGGAAMAKLAPQAAKSRRVDVIRLSADDDRGVTDRWLFETLWHGRACFVVDDPARVRPLLDECARALADRRALRARARRTFHLVWDRAEPVPAELHDQLVSLLGATGGSLFLLRAATVS